MKRNLSLLLFLTISFLIMIGCGNKQNEIKLNTNEIVDSLYDGLTVGEDIPKLVNTELDEENIIYYLGVDLEFEEGTISEPMMSSKAHSIVVVKVKDSVNVEQAKKDILKKAQEELYNKWICVEATQIKVISKGHTILLIMTDDEELTKKIETNFNKL